MDAPTCPIHILFGRMDPYLKLELETPEIRSMEFTYPNACPTFSFPLLSSTETVTSEEFHLILRSRFIEDDSTSEDVGTASDLPNSSSEPVKTGNSLASGSGDLGPYLAEMRRFKKRCIGYPFHRGRP